MDLSMSAPLGASHQFNLMLVRDCRDFRAIAGAGTGISDGGAEMAGDRIDVVRAVQKLIVERSTTTNAFGRTPSPGLRTPPPGRTMYCISG